MAWKIINNSEPNYFKEEFSTECPKLHQMTTITKHYTGSKWCETDLRKTYHLSGYKCSLLEGTSAHGFSTCAETCPLVQEK